MTADDGGLQFLQTVEQYEAEQAALLEEVNHEISEIDPEESKTSLGPDGSVWIRQDVWCA